VRGRTGVAGLRPSRGAHCEPHIRTAAKRACNPDAGTSLDAHLFDGLKKATGTIKEKAGKVTGDRPLDNEGTAEKAEGHIRSGVGKAMDAVREVVSKEQ
jgi:uncharacterized protein YjbJ (UPF0337 family)